MGKRVPKIHSYGFFNVDKPSGIVSSTVVNKLKWLSGLPCGHMGTLDPLASGVLPVGVGNATRLFDYFLEKEKEYIAEFTFGVDSDTLDSTGTLIYGGHVPGEREIVQLLPTMTGEIMQMPPKYSAKNVNGKRGYELARAGIEFELQPKKIVVHDMQLLGQTNENTYRIKIRCGGGTYIRSIARDMAAALGTKAVMSGLRRTQSGIFTLQNAIPFEVLEKDPPLEELEKYLIPTDSVLPFETLALTEVEMGRILQGQRVKTSVADGIYKIYTADGFYGLAEVLDGLAKAKTKLC
jgi:tRNA pseudouridine55 synthase